MLLHHDRLVYLNTVLTKKFEGDLEEKENWPDLLHRIRTFTYFMRTHCISLGIASTMYGLGPIIALIKSGVYIRALPAIYPFHYEPGGLVHWIIYAIELLGTISTWTIATGVDCVFGLYALQMCGELRILTKRFRNLRLSPDYRKQMKECIERHHMLVTVKNTLETVFGLISLWLAISGALVLCSVIFQISEVRIYILFL